MLPSDPPNFIKLRLYLTSYQPDNLFLGLFLWDRELNIFQNSSMKRKVYVLDLKETFQQVMQQSNF
jgi:hypothetical protein